METGVSDSWILANLTDNKTVAEGEGFETAKQKANGVHFLAIQSPIKSESFAAFWLLMDPRSLIILICIQKSNIQLTKLIYLKRSTWSFYSLF